MTSGIAQLWLLSERGRRSRKEVAEREQRERQTEKEKSHEATRPSGFSLAESSVNGVQADWEKHEMDTWEGKGD